jgi:hypothetical protein
MQLIIFIFYISFLLANNVYPVETKWESEVILEDFEYQTQDKLSKAFPDSQIWTKGSSLKLFSDSENAKRCSLSLKLIYEPASESSWAGIQKQFIFAQDWSNFNAVSFWIYGDSSNNEISFMFKDKDGESWMAPWIRLDWVGWKRFEFLIADMAQDPYSMVKTGNTKRDLDEVKAFLFIIKGGANSKINIDAIELDSDKILKSIPDAIRSEIPEGYFRLLIEDFNYSSNDELMRIYPLRAVWTNKASLSYSLESGEIQENQCLVPLEQNLPEAATQKPDINTAGPLKNYLKLVYVPRSNDSWAVLQKRFSSAKDWSGIKGIEFWLYGDNSYNEIAMMFRDADNEAWQIPWIQLGWAGWRRFYYDFNDLVRDPYDSVKDVNLKKDFNEVKSLLVILRGGGEGNIYLSAINLISASSINLSEKIGLQVVPSFNKIYLYWNDSSNPFILKYIVYRDGEMIGYAHSLFYTDDHLSPGIEYRYQVSAYFTNGAESEKSEAKSGSLKQGSMNGNIKVDKDWLIVNGEKFFIRGIGYSPFRPYRDPSYDSTASLDMLEQDMRLIKEAGFNTLRTWDAMDERQLIMAEKYGLIVMQGLSIDPRGDFNNPEFIRNSLRMVEEKVNQSKNHDNILCYMLINEPDIQAVIKAGVEPTSNLLKEAVKVVRNIDPDRLISASLWVPTDFLDTSMLDFVCFNIYNYGSPMITQDMGYDNYIRCLKKIHAQDKPLVISEFGYSVSPLGPGNYEYGGNTEDMQKEGIINNVKQIISAGATGFCVFEWIDEWWKNFDYSGDARKHERDDPEEWFGILGIADDNSDIQGTPRPAYYSLRNMLSNFDAFYKDSLYSAGLNKDFMLDINTDKDQYVSSDIIKVIFTLEDKQKMPLAGIPITYTLTDNRNSIKTTGKGDTDNKGKIYFNYVSLPCNKSTVATISAGADFGKGLKAVNLKHIFIEEDKKYTLKRRTTKIIKAFKAPHIDGIFDSLWKDAEPVLLKGVVSNMVLARIGNWEGESDLSAKVYLLWDESDLYIFGDVIDDFPAVNKNNGSGIWDGDALELFLSMNPNKIPETGYSQDDFQIILGANEKMWIYGQAKGGTRNQEPKDSKIKVKRREKGYTIEAKIALSNFTTSRFESRRILGFDLAIDDADETQKREVQLIWSGIPTDYQHSQYWGRCILTGKPEHKKKGVLDGIWKIFKR